MKGYQKLSLSSLTNSKTKHHEEERFFSDEDEFDDVYYDNKEQHFSKRAYTRKPKTVKQTKCQPKFEQEHNTHDLGVGDAGSATVTATPSKVEHKGEEEISTKGAGGETAAEKKEIQLTKEFALTRGISRVFKYSVAHNKDQGLDNQLKKVASLHLQKKGIQTMAPDGLKSFHSLAHLYLYDNHITKLAGLEYLPQLESLHLSGNRIRRIENLENLFNLRQLYLGNNEIEIVEGLDNLSMLVELHIEYQKLPKQQALIFCPNSLDTISRRLKVLNVKGNQLENIDDLMCMDVLDTLNLSRNKIKDLDHVSIILRTLRHLRVLDLRENNICKDPKYKEKIIGFCGGLEILDGKEINDMQRTTLQRLCSLKAMRLRNQVLRTGTSPIPVTSFPATNYTRMDSRQAQPMGMAPSTFVVSDFNEQFQFSTPISASPTHLQPPTSYECTLNDLLAQGEAEESDPSISEATDFVSGATTSQLEEDNEPEKMSEMAKIIFRLSNLSPSTNNVNQPREHLSSYYWGSGQGQGRSLNFKESRPLSPLEVDVTSSIAPLVVGSRRSVPGTIRRTMAKKLPPRQTHGAGRTLSPLEELPTPDSTSTRERDVSDWFGQSFQTSTCQLPPWPHISRKKGVAPPKVNFMP